MDTFIEYMIPRKRSTKDIAKIFGAVIGAIAACVVIGFLITISPQWLFIVWFMAAVFVWYGVYIIISRQNVEYEYSFTNGELDVDAIYSKRRRVHLLNVKVREFDICAPAYDERFTQKYLDVSGVKNYYKVAGSMESQNVYFADFMRNGDKVRLYFEPPKKMIEAIKRFNVRNVYLPEEK